MNINSSLDWHAFHVSPAETVKRLQRESKMKTFNKFQRGHNLKKIHKSPKKSKVLSESCTNVNMVKSVKRRKQQMITRQCKAIGGGKSYFSKEIQSSCSKKKSLSNTEQYECKTCKRVFTLDSFKTFLPDEHKDESGMPLYCSVCLKAVMKDIGNMPRTKTEDSAGEVSPYDHFVIDQNQNMVFERKCISHKPYKCQVCGSRFQQRSQLQEHLAFHTVPKLEECEVCKRLFASSSQKMVHMRLHHSENTGKSLECTVCGKFFRLPWTLKVHMRTHTGEKPYSCTHCGREFAQSYAKMSHEKTHTGERPHQCDVCGKRFIRRYLCAYHMKKCRVVAK